MAVVFNFEPKSFWLHTEGHPIEVTLVAKNISDLPIGLVALSTAPPPLVVWVKEVTNKDEYRVWHIEPQGLSPSKEDAIINGDREWLIRHKLTYKKNKQ